MNHGAALYRSAYNPCRCEVCRAGHAARIAAQRERRRLVR